MSSTDKRLLVSPDFPRNIPEVEALLAENQRLRDELCRISEICDCGAGTDALEALAAVGNE